MIRLVQFFNWCMADDNIWSYLVGVTIFVLVVGPLLAGVILILEKLPILLLTLVLPLCYLVANTIKRYKGENK